MPTMLAAVWHIKISHTDLGTSVHPRRIEVVRMAIDHPQPDIAENSAGAGETPRSRLPSSPMISGRRPGGHECRPTTRSPTPAPRQWSRVAHVPRWTGHGG